MRRRKNAMHLRPGRIIFPRRLRIAALTTAVFALVGLLGVAVIVAAGPVLTFVEVQRDGAGGVDGLDAATSATVSADGKHLYVAGAFDNAVAVFSRNSTTGALTFVEAHKDGVGGVDGLLLPRSVALSPDGKHLYAAGQNDDAVAVFSRNSTTGTLNFVEVQKDGVGGVDGLDGAYSVTVSPDGRHLYAASSVGSAVVVFSRNSTTGALTFVEVHKDGVGGVDGLGDAQSVTVSPDGKHLYVGSVSDDAVAVFSRDSTTGALTFVEAQKDGVDGVDGLDVTRSVTVSPDGKHLYAAGSFDNAVAVFNRDSTTGALTFVEVLRDGVGGVDGLSGSTSVTVSSDGKHLYAAAGFLDDAVAVFSRDSTTGALTFVEALKDGVGGVDGLDEAESVTLSPDGKHLYAAGPSDDAVAVFSRNSTTGALTFVEIQRDGVGGVDGLDGARSVTVSPDGNHLYAAGVTDDAVAVFSRDSTTGALTFVEVHKDGVGGVDGLDGASSVTVSPDGKHLYASSFFDDSLVVFSRNSTTGALTFVGLHKDGVGGVDGLDGAHSVTLSPDGNHLYVAGQLDDMMATFSRNSTTGALTFVEVHKDGVGGVDGLLGARSVTVSPDGNHLYAAGVTDDAVAVFSRNSTTGALIFVEVHKDGVGGVDGLDGANSVTVSPDGNHLYAAGSIDDSMAVFSRNSTTGALTFVEVLKDGVGAVDGLLAAASATVSPDGKHVYAASQAIDDSVAVFSRNSTTGALTFVEVLKDGVGGVEGLNGAFSVTVSADGKHLYAAGRDDDAVAVFSVASADLSVTKSGSPDPVVAGNTLTYTITVANNGPDTSTSVVVTDDLPAGVAFSSASSGCTESGGTVTCNIGDLATNASTTLTIAVAVASSTTGTLTNSAEVSGAENEPDTGNDSAVATTTISTAAAVPGVSLWGLIGMAVLMAALVLWRGRRAWVA